MYDPDDLILFPDEQSFVESRPPLITKEHEKGVFIRASRVRAKRIELHVTGGASMKNDSKKYPLREYICVRIVTSAGTKSVLANYCVSRAVQVSEVPTQTHVLSISAY